MITIRTTLSYLSMALLLTLQVGCSKNSSNNIITTPPPQQRGNITSNVVFATNKDWQGNTQALTMDIYQPTNAKAGKKYPLVINVHGGGFYSGDKASAGSKCQIYADSGFVAVTINYRLGWNGAGAASCQGDTTSLNEAMYRAVQDINASLRYLVAHADEYNIDPNWIFVSGASAGGVVVQTSSYENDKYMQSRYPAVAAKLGGVQNAGNNLINTYTIKGICSIAGALPDSALINASKAIPTIFFQGGADDVVPVDHGTYLGCSNYQQLYGSLCLYRQLIANGQPAIANILPGAGHGNNGDSGFTDDFMIGNAANFFNRLVRNENIKSKVNY
ncbi:alpha/beta hydrolase [Limnovirga soli]|uniref:Carboxylesterase family protein n=1 Tax=Limnovirga soli TaxID=2656915 RepID=A0A8J8JUI2_9BACT|nr:alpha/beta hydrolase [Limnovirga soli]NNV55579.1 carboxylesterase family protein [Limnovirga soli]